MRDAADISVQHAVVHIIGHLNQETILSEKELALNGDGALREYFSGQVRNALNDKQTGSARFAAAGDQAPRAACYRILADERDFIPSSQELARMLVTAMGTDQRIKPGSLAVCVYTASNYPSTNFLALIKLDPGQALVQKVATEDGKRVVSFDVRGDVMPTAREKLHKAALVPPAEDGREFDLLLLDRQVEGVASFFAQKFLNTTEALDAKTSTNRFYVALREAHHDLLNPTDPGVKPISSEAADAILDYADISIRSPFAQISSLVRRLPKETRPMVKKKLLESFPEDERIVIDPETALEILKKKRFRGDYGVLFEVESIHYGDVVRKNEVKQLPNGTTVNRLTIEVPNWHWVK